MVMRERDRVIERLGLDVQFQPSRDTKLWCRFTRKIPSTFAGVTLPGLFQTRHFTRDTALFVLALVFEVWGLWNFLVAGQIRIIYIVFLFLLDLALAILRHLPVGTICELRNRIVYETATTMKAHYAKKIAIRRLASRLISGLIFVLAGFKIFSFYAIQGELDGLTLGVMVSYFFVAVLHVSVTGYFLSELIWESSYWLDERSFVRKTAAKEGSALAVTDHVVGDFGSDVELVPLEVSQHVLERNGDRWRFKTWGVLTDQELHAFIYRQPTEDARRTVAVEGLRHQVERILAAEVSR